MRSIHKARAARTLAAMLLVAITGLLAPLPASAADPVGLPQIAVVQVVNQSGSSVQNLAARMAVALNERLAASGQYKVIGQAAVDQAMTTHDIRLPFRANTRNEQLGQIAGTIGARYLVLSSISSVETDAEKQVAVVKAVTQVFDVNAKGDVTEVSITAFNLDRSKIEGLLIDDALEQCAHSTVAALTTQLNTTGRVLRQALESTAVVSFKEPERLRLGAELVVLRNGLRIAVLQVLKFVSSHAECRIIEQTVPQMTIGTNDDVVLYRQGSGRLASSDPDWDPIKEVPTSAERKRASQASLWAALGGVALLGLGIWAFTQGEDKRDNARTANLVSPPDGATIEVNAANQLVNQVSFTTTSTKDTDTITLQIASDTNFSQLALARTTVAGGGTGGVDEDNNDLVPVTTFIFDPATDSAFLAPGTYYWRVIAVDGNNRYTSQVWRFQVVRQGGNNLFLTSPSTVLARSFNNQVEVQWTPVTGAAGYRVFRRILTPRAANDRPAGRTFRPSSGSNTWLRGSARRSVGVDRDARRPSGMVTAGGRQSAVPAGFSQIAAVDATVTSYTDTTVVNGIEYEWLVLTVDVAGNLTPLDQALAGSFAAATPLNSAPPATPLNLTATPGDGQVTLTWTMNTENDLAGYQVFRSTSPTGNFVDLSTNLVLDSGSLAGQALSAGPNDVVVVDRQVTNGVMVHYRIRAIQVTVQESQPGGGVLTRGGLESPLSEPVAATPTTAPPQELQVIQPPNGSNVDADRPLLAWRGVTSATQYTLEISPFQTFTAGTVIAFQVNETEVIYPSSQPNLVPGTTYYMRVGIFDESIQALRYGPVSMFTRGDVARFTTTVRTTLAGQPLNGARLLIDNADSGKLSPAEFILARKPSDAPYVIEAVFDRPDGTRLQSVPPISYRPGIDNSTVTVPLTAVGVAPAVPTGLDATGEADRVVLRWNPDPNLGTPGIVVAREYSVQRRSNTSEGPFQEIARLTAPQTAGPQGANQLRFSDFNVRSGVRYFYQVVAISQTGVTSLPSVITNAVPGVGAIQVITPQDNQTFGVFIDSGGLRWNADIDFAWVAVQGATRYVFEIGVDPNLNDLLENGNEVIPASDLPQYTLQLAEELPPGFIFVNDGGLTVQTLYWRVVAVDDSNRILNQTEARRVFVDVPGVIPQP